MEQKYIDYLIKEMGERYQDLIEMDFDITVEEFCSEYLREDGDGVYSEI